MFRILRMFPEPLYKTLLLQLIKSIVFVYSYPIRKDVFYEQTH
jgi:hypothetical protein